MSVGYQYVDLPKINREVPESVALYIREAKKMLPHNPYKIERVKIPKFAHYSGKLRWEIQEIEKCINGTNAMCGKQYFYYNYCKIQDIERGTIRPDYRVVDNEWFKLIESCRAGKENEGFGIICVKGRRGGFSWKAAADAVHDAIFNHSYNVGMNSKTERDGYELFKKVSFIFNNLPSFLRIPTDGGKARDKLIFATKEVDELGKERLTGNMSEVFVKAPVSEAFEGLMLNKWVCDEAGKIINVLDLWILTNPCLEVSGKRKGIPIIFGTAGEVEKGGKGQKELWHSSDSYGLKRFFFPGWMATSKFCDDKGNIDVEAAVLDLLEERKRFEGLTTYDDRVQQYPLTIKEAFLERGGAGVGNIVEINKQLDYLDTNRPKYTTGSFKWAYGTNEEVIWIPSPDGKCKVYEPPVASLKNGYVAGCDPADHDYVNKRASDLSMYIMKKQHNAEPPRVVFSYTDRPLTTEEYYEQAMMALIYYNNTKVLIESNRNGMIKYFKYANMVGKLLRTEPVPRNKLKTIFIPKIGISKTVYSTKEMERCINEYTNNYCHYIPERELLVEFLEYGLKNTDRAVAFGWTVVALDDDASSPLDNNSNPKKINPTFGYKRDSSGNIRRTR